MRTAARWEADQNVQAASCVPCTYIQDMTAVMVSDCVLRRVLACRRDTPDSVVSQAAGLNDL